MSSLIRIDFSGKAGAKAGVESTSTRNEDKIHTPASLFMHLRTLLRGKKWLQSDSISLRPKPGDVVEFTAQMKPNPLTETLDTFVEILEMQQALSGHSGKGKAAANDPQKMKKQMQAMSSALRGGTTSDLTTAPLESKYRCIITLENQYLNDPTMSYQSAARRVRYSVRRFIVCRNLPL